MFDFERKNADELRTQALLEEIRLSRDKPATHHDLFLDKRAMAKVIAFLVRTLAENDRTLAARLFARTDAEYYKARELPSEEGLPEMELYWWMRELLREKPRVTVCAEPVSAEGDPNGVSRPGSEPRTADRGSGGSGPV
jgi:hypothetical protein